jgi:type II secretory ATPase GspE/PulE/Tfp pilus assembly ATPase PilB-like protein
MRRLIAERKDVGSDLRGAGAEAGMRTLRQDTLAKVPRAGATSLSEVVRVVA